MDYSYIETGVNEVTESNKVRKMYIKCFESTLCQLCVFAVVLNRDLRESVMVALSTRGDFASRHFLLRLRKANMVLSLIFLLTPNLTCSDVRPHSHTNFFFI